MKQSSGGEHKEMAMTEQTNETARAICGAVMNPGFSPAINCNRTWPHEGEHSYTFAAAIPPEPSLRCPKCREINLNIRNTYVGHPPDKTTGECYTSRCRYEGPIAEFYNIAPEPSPACRICGKASQDQRHNTYQGGDHDFLPEPSPRPELLDAADSVVYGSVGMNALSASTEVAALLKYHKLRKGLTEIPDNDPFRKQLRPRPEGQGGTSE